MKALLKQIWIIVCIVLCLCACAAAEEAEERSVALSPVRAVVSAQSGTAEIHAVEIDKETWLFLPAFANVDELKLYLDDQPVEWQERPSNDIDVRCLQLLLEDDLFVYVMKSRNLRSLFLFSDDPVSRGRSYIESSPRHETFTTAEMALVSPDGQVDASGKVAKLRGRGNGTWSADKRPYQMKLEQKADLLATGDRSEKNRTWVLLAEAMDGTFLRNRITLDLALEMGLEETSHSEFVDLYYDGEYRGLYLLAEKTEINEGRIDEQDYDDLLEEWNKQVGRYDLESLPSAQGENRFGLPYAYIDGVVSGTSPDQGAYLIEMENPDLTLSDRCFFRLSDGRTYALKNPENASQNMLVYVSERMEEALQTLKNGGFNPETGRSIEDDFDVDAFARTALIQELSANPDGFLYSSSFFVLPDGQKQFRPGPVWDFDLAWHFMTNGKNSGGVGLKDQQSWLTEFYRSDAFVSCMQQIYLEEMTPLIQNILLGNEQGRWLKPLKEYQDQIAMSAKMNAKLWKTATNKNLVYGNTAEEESELLRSFIAQRSRWLQDRLAAWKPDEDVVDIWVHGVYGYAPNDELEVRVYPWSHAKIREMELEQITEATETDYALWRLDITLDAEDGRAWRQPSVMINAVPVTVSLLDDGAVQVSAVFEDPSYRPVDYYGEDIGMVYDYDQYILNHPEVLEICGEDPELVMEYFCDEGMYEDHKGNAFFRPSEILASRPALYDMLGEDWSMYYWDYMMYGFEDGWLSKVKSYYCPDVQDAGNE